MREKLIAIFFCSLGVLLARGNEADDKEKFQGTWKVISAKTGDEEADRAFTGRKVTIAKDKIEFFNQGGESEGKITFTLDPKKMPKKIDLHDIKEGKKRTALGIYAINDNRLRLCVSGREGGTRPVDFEKVGGEDMLRAFVLERQKE